MFELWGCILLRMAWREKIIEILKEEKEGLTRKEIEEKLNTKRSNVRKAIIRMLDNRELVEVRSSPRVWKLKLREEK